MRPCLVVSPHMDDAVLSLGQFLAGRPRVTVVTVFAGLPENWGQLTDYDAKSGFSSGFDAMSRRAQEDERALGVLKAWSWHLSHTDSQYGEATDFDAVVADLQEAIRNVEPEFIVGPLGLHHPDHQLTRLAFLEAAKDVPHTPAYLYEELPYRVEYPEAVTDAFAEVRKLGYTYEPASIGDGPLELKEQAIARYQSQLWALNERCLYVPERVWLLRAS